MERLLSPIPRRDPVDDDCIYGRAISLCFLFVSCIAIKVLMARLRSLVHHTPPRIWNGRRTTMIEGPWLMWWTVGLPRPSCCPDRPLDVLIRLTVLPVPTPYSTLLALVRFREATCRSTTAATTTNYMADGPGSKVSAWIVYILILPSKGFPVLLLSSLLRELSP